MEIERNIKIIRLTDQEINTRNLDWWQSRANLLADEAKKLERELTAERARINHLTQRLATHVERI